MDPVQKTNVKSRASGSHNDPRASKGKDAAFWKILNSALELDFKKGHLKWTMSDLSRKSGVTRSLIYYYFGRSKVSILRDAVRVIGEEFIGLGPDRQALWVAGRGAESMKATREIYEKSPHLGPFYLMHRDRDTEIGESLRALEQGFARKVRQLFPNMTPAWQQGVMAVLFGISFWPHTNEETLENMAALIQRVAKTGRIP